MFSSLVSRFSRSDVSPTSADQQNSPKDTPSQQSDESWQRLTTEPTDGSLLDQLAQRISLALPALQNRSWELLYNSLADGVCVTELDGTIKHANRAFTAILNVADSSALVDQNIATALRRVAPFGIEELSTRIETRHHSFVCELRQGDDLDDGVLRVSRLPMTDDSGHVESTVWTLRDVTHQRLADDVRNQFVCTATHELRTPLGNLRAYAETLAREDAIDVEKQKEFCNIIHKEATRLARFVDELLNISRMEGGALSVVRHETDLARMLQEVLDHVRPQVEQRGQILQASLPARLPKLQVDKDKLTASLINVLSNASKYTPIDGHIRFEVECHEDRLMLHVEDSGFGISAEDIPHIFDKFFRSSDDRIRRIEGSGLGLAFSREVVRLHGGRLTVHSELNRGSRFTLTLPITQTLSD